MRSLDKVFALAIVAAVAPIHGAFATTIDFDTLKGSYLSSFTSYTENGFTVATKSGNFYVNDGTDPVIGDLAPDLVQDDELSSKRSESLVLTKVGGGTFTFDSLDVHAFTADPTYDIAGMLGGTKVYDYSGLVPYGAGGGAGFEALNPGETSQLVSSVILTFAQPDDPLNQETTLFDNIIVDAAPTSPAPVPEPSTLSLLGSGLAGVVTAVRRRSRKA